VRYICTITSTHEFDTGEAIGRRTAEFWLGEAAMTNVFSNPIGFYKTREVCVLLKVCRQTLNRYREKAAFPAPAIFVIGGENRYSISEVHAWIRENKEIIARAALAGRNIRSRLVRRRSESQTDRPASHSSEMQAVADAT
jgi:predicted DNA-binding transcriptional regulator AlpA